MPVGRMRCTQGLMETKEDVRRAAENSAAAAGKGGWGAVAMKGRARLEAGRA